MNIVSLFFTRGNMKVWKTAEKRLRDFLLDHGYTCDSCGGEVFDYPSSRLCERCQSSLRRVTNACEKCGRQKTAEGICMDCKNNMPKFTRGISPLVYRGRVSALINRMKNGNPRLACFFGETLAEAFLSATEPDELAPFQSGEDTFLLVPVPMTDKRVAERGYNQAERIAERVQKRLQEHGFSVELMTDVLQKRKDTPPQKQMSYTERLENVSGAYHVHKRTACQNRTVLLVDDVMTTGATSSECAARLFGAGAKDVYFLGASSLEERK